MDVEFLETLLECYPEVDLDTFRCKEDDNNTGRHIILNNFPDIEYLPDVWEPNPERGAVDYRYRLFYFLQTGQEMRFCKTYRDAMGYKLKDENVLQTCTDGQRFTFLQHACEKGFKKAVKILLRHNFDVNLAQHDTDRPVVLATKSGHSDILSQLLKVSDIDLSPTSQGLTLIHLAVASNENAQGLFECLRYLLRHSGLDVNAKDKKGRTALHFAVKYAEDPCIFALIDSGARLDTPNHYKKTPLTHISASTYRKYLDSKLSTNKKPEKDHNFVIKLDYQIAASKGQCDEHVCGINTRLLCAISDSPNLRELLSHPIYATIILFKWHRIRLFFYVHLFFYTIFCLLFTSYIYYGDKLCQLHGRNMSDINGNETVTIWGGSDEYYEIVIKNFLLMFLIVMAVGEILQCYHKPRLYAVTLENWIQIAQITLATSALVSECITRPQSREICPQLNSIAVLFAWFEIFFVIGSYPKLTFFIDMFRTASKFLFQFFIVHVPLIIAFAFSFHVLFKEEESPFSSIMSSIFKTLVMVTGEFDVGDIPLNSIGSYLVFCAFIFLVAIVLFNLLIGLAVSATRPIEDDAYLYSCIAQVPVIMNFESIFFDDSHILKKLYAWTMRCFLQRNPTVDNDIYPVLNVYPNRRNQMLVEFYSTETGEKIHHRKNIRIRYHLTKKIVYDAQQILTSKKDTQKCDKVDELRQQIESMQTSMEGRLISVETALAQVLEKLELREIDETDGPGLGHRRRKGKIGNGSIRKSKGRAEQRKMRDDLDMSLE